jgi:hypothetical protein
MGSNYNVARRWAGHNMGTNPSRWKDYANGSSMKYQGPCIYSYRTAIGRWYNDYVLIRLNSWGVTTARHINIAAGYVYGVKPVFRVPSIGFEAEINHGENVEYLKRELRNDQTLAVRHFKNSSDGSMPYWESDSIRRTYGTLAHYCQLNHLPTGIDTVDEILTSINELRRAKWLSYHDPKAVAKRERAQARRQAKIALGVE